MPKRSQIAPFRKADLDNLPLQEARHRFIEQFAKHCPLRRTLFGWPLRRWKALSEGARRECQPYGWVAIRYCETYRDLLPDTLANNPELEEEQRVHLEMIPLYKALSELARTLELRHNGEPATWAMDTLLENLHQRARRPKAKLSDQWFRPIQMSQAYPARIEEGLTRAGTDLPEEELCHIVITIPPKQPNEGIRAFEKRFNDICRKERRRYIEALRAEGWSTEPAPAGFKWIDYLAQWQAGLPQSKIGPAIKTKADRSKLSRGIRAAAEYIEITRRESPHSSHHTGDW